jgi:hypothetical protein
MLRLNPSSLDSFAQDECAQINSRNSLEGTSEASSGRPHSSSNDDIAHGFPPLLEYLVNKVLYYKYAFSRVSTNFDHSSKLSPPNIKNN